MEGQSIVCAPRKIQLTTFIGQMLCQGGELSLRLQAERTNTAGGTDLAPGSLHKSFRCRILVNYVLYRSPVAFKVCRINSNNVSQKIKQTKSSKLEDKIQYLSTRRTQRM